MFQTTIVFTEFFATTIHYEVLSNLSNLSRGPTHLEILNICSSCKKQLEICNTWTIASKNNFFIKSSVFVLVP